MKISYFTMRKPTKLRPRKIKILIIASNFNRVLNMLISAVPSYKSPKIRATVS